MADTKKHTHCYDASIRVLFYKEDDSWVAHALEMDLLGFGKSTKLAFKDLEKNIAHQLSFAAFKGNPESVFFMAPQDIVSRWEAAQLISLKQSVSGNRESAATLNMKAATISFTKEEFERLMAKGPPSSLRGGRDQWEPSLAAA